MSGYAVAIHVLDDEGNPVWVYDHAEQIPAVDDDERAVLSLLDGALKHVDRGRVSIEEQGRAALELMKKGQPPPGGSGEGRSGHVGRRR